MIVSILKLKFKKDVVIRMNYSNYEREIVEAYGIELKNFPGGVVQQPGSLKRPVLQDLVAALNDPTKLSSADGSSWMRRPSVLARLLTRSGLPTASKFISLARRL